MVHFTGVVRQAKVPTQLCQDQLIIVALLAARTWTRHFECEAEPLLLVISFETRAPGVDTISMSGVQFASPLHRGPGSVYACGIDGATQPTA